MAESEDTTNLSGEEWAAAAAANPWPGDARTDPGPLYVEDYEPNFDRMGVHRRVLGHITDEDHVGRGPRNTPERLDRELDEDPFTPYTAGHSDVQALLDELEGAGLVEKREDGTYGVTQAGLVELAN